MEALALLAVFVGGVCIALQGPTNASLGKIAGTIQASFVSFSGGFLIILVLAIAIGEGDFGNLPQAQWWMCLGGVYGAFIVAGTVICAPVLGMALTLTILMFGQLVAGMVIDVFGLFMVSPIAVNPLRLVGCVLLAIGIAGIYRGKIEGEAREGRSSLTKTAITIVIAVLVGVAGALQAPTNTALSGVLGGTLEAGVVSFAGGWFLLAAMLLVKNWGSFGLSGVRQAKAWQCTGGVYGAYCVLTMMLATPLLGVTLSLAGGWLGQMIAGVVVDTFGLLRSPRIRMNAWRWAGIAFIAVGVVVTTVAKMA
ncbi:MAG: DMT family transporter [Eggerthellaceae bacterium]|nr:DMT family transporter [Eggerthellaceae bacterium]